MSKQTICICENKGAFVFATSIVQFLYFLNSKFPASSHLLFLYSSVCVRRGRKPHCWFSHDAAHIIAGNPNSGNICLFALILVLDLRSCVKQCRPFAFYDKYLLRNISVSILCTCIKANPGYFHTAMAKLWSKPRSFIQLFSALPWGWGWGRGYKCLVH